MPDIYTGDSFSISRQGNDWTIWRIDSDTGTREQLILTDKAMDELRDYFADFYTDDAKNRF